MRIGIPIRHLDSRRGGLEMYFTRMSRWLVAHGHEVHLFAGRVGQQVAGANIHVVHPFVPETVRTAASARRLDVLVGSDKAVGMNVFQPHGGTVPSNIGQVLARIPNPFVRKTLTLLNEINPKYLAAVRQERRQYGQEQPRPQFVAVSRRIADEMRRFYAVPEERLHVVHNGVDVDRFCPERCARMRDTARRTWGITPDTVCFLLVAHDFYLKGLRELVLAAAHLKRIGGRFCILVVGRGSPRPFSRLARRLGCDDYLRFAGAIAEVEPAYAAADVYVHPSWYDAFSLAVLEAWSCGLPVITTRFTGASELMTPRQEGYLIDTPAHTGELAERMRELLDADLRSRMGRLGRLLAEQHAEEENFRRMVSIFEGAAAENPIGRLLEAA